MMKEGGRERAEAELREKTTFTEPLLWVLRVLSTFHSSFQSMR